MRLHRWAVLALLLATARASTGDEPAKGPANRLAKETSPYLLMHAHNPVDWYPWGPEAFAKAKAEGKPIFLSVGYSSCYWCHVMERESFLDPEIAKVLNAGYVAIKVDREERPDVDQVYMTAIQALNGSGGWPMSAFLMPDGRPFFGGTYFKPKEFLGLLKAVSDAWRDQRPSIEKDAASLSDAVRRASSGPARASSPVPLNRDLARGGRAALAEQFDPEFGGFGFDPGRPKRPKFPEPVNLLYLLDQGRRDRSAGLAKPAGPDPLAMALKTFDAMARGGIRDHLAGGYHRYSTVRDWSIPHFEKMLYDNAQLAEALVLAFEATGDPRWKAEAEATFGFVARTLTSPAGLFDSSLDAESQGEEGKSYLWTRAEVEAILGPADYAFFAPLYAFDGEPDLDDGRYVLLQPKVIVDPAVEARLVPLRAKLLAARDARPAPSLDDKVLTSWNALMIAAYAEAARVLKEGRYRLAADKAADALLALMMTPDGRLLRTARGGKAKLPAYLEDYASLAQGLLKLHKATGEPKRLAQARALADRMIADFSDREAGGFFYTAGDHEALIARVKDPFDNAVPGANSLAIRALVGLGIASGEGRYLDEARRALESFAPSLKTRPGGSPLMLLALEEYLDARPAAPLEDEPSAAPLPGAPGVVVAEASLAKPARVTPGGEFEVEITLRVKDRYHLYANPAGSENAIPTVLGLAPGSLATMVEVKYPPGEAKALDAGGLERVAVYEGKAVLTARIKLPEDAKPGPSPIKLRLKYQACDDRACLAPATLDVPVSVEVAPR